MVGEQEPAAASRDDDDDDELRLALVLNGGVSLAIWMGGVVREIDRLRRREEPYDGVLRLTRSSARVDVIAGASAGGMNGALLGLAIARGTRVDPVRDVWMQDGAIDVLLRDPLQKDPPSLLRGEEFFLPHIVRAFDTVAGRPEETAAADAGPVTPLRLMITTTMLEGEAKGYDDYFGEPIPDVDNRGLLRFQRGDAGEPRVRGNAEYWPDDFAPDGAPDRAVRRLALAARSTASFPGAFESSFCPVAPANGDGLDENHPDLEGIANFSSSRWVMDGGVLVNTPFRPALGAIALLPAERQVRRVLAYVVPNAGTVARPTPAQRGDPPRLLAVVRDALTTLPRVQSIGEDLAGISENNRQVQRRRYARDALLTGLAADGLRRAATSLLPTYAQVRRKGGADDVRSLLLRRPETEQGEAERLALLDRAVAGPVPWAPPPLAAGETWETLALDPWHWGIAPVEHSLNATLDLLQRAMREPAFKALRPGLREQRRAVHAVLADVRAVQRGSERYWRESVPGALDASEASVAIGSVVAGWSFGPAARDLQERLATILVATAALLGPADAEAQGEPATLRRIAFALAPPDGAGTPVERSMRQLLALDVVQRSGGPDLGGIDQEIRLVLCSGNAANAFDQRYSVDAKLVGRQVQHFGSFYKQSWRANDWMWGRLDGADRLARLLVDGTRLHQLVREGVTHAELVDGLEQACTLVDGRPDPYLVAEFPRAEIGAELAAQLRPDGPAPQPNELRLSHAAVRRSIQLGILREELPLLAAAALSDVSEDRTLAGARGARWARELPPGWHESTESLLDAFRRCDIGEERIESEIGSDHFTAVSTTAAGVLGSVASQLVPKAAPTRIVARAVRGLSLSLYLLARGVLGGTRTETFVVALTLALGGALLALAVVGAGVPGIFAALGAIVIVAAFLLALIRHRGVQAGILVALGAIVVAGSYYLSDHHTFAPWVNRLAPAVAVVLVAVLALLLGGVDLRERRER
jgi:predicted acylesterase/phospholipase RssA